MVRENPDGARTPLTMPNHSRIKGSTLRTICTQAGPGDIRFSCSLRIERPHRVRDVYP